MISPVSEIVVNPTGSLTTPTADRSAQLANLLAIALAIVVCIVYWPVRTHAFISLDDPAYVAGNAHVHAGLSWAGCVWAFTTAACANYHPLVWLVHMAAWDCFGENPAGHHLLSVALHAGSGALLLLFLYRSTGAPWRSAIVAAVFALHPLRVESVAWVAELKDTLSTFLFMATLLAWRAYVIRPSGARYWSSVAMYVLGLLAKPMLVTLPVLLLLLDVWPFKRVRSASTIEGRWWPLVKEKLPLFVCAGLSAIATVIAQGRGGAIATLNSVSVPDRFSNAIVSCMLYLRDTIWPTQLALGYPHPATVGIVIPSTMIISAVATILAITLVALFALRRGVPQLGIGWLWFLVSLLPVLGIIQVGGAARADRYTYIPHVGLLVAIVFSIPPAVFRRAGSRAVLGVVGAVIVVLLTIATRRQLAYWQDESTLADRALSLDPLNYAARLMRADAEAADGQFTEAIANNRAALRYLSRVANAHLALAKTLGGANRPREAVLEYRATLACDPHFLDPVPDLRHTFALQLAQSGDLPAAIEQWKLTLEADPKNAQAELGIATAYTLSGKPAEAARHLESAVRLKPNWIEPLGRLAWLRVNSDDPSLIDDTQAKRLINRALELASQSVGSEPQKNRQTAELLDTLAMTYARDGRFTEAIATATSAATAARKASASRLEQIIQSHLAAYKESQLPPHGSGTQ